MAKRKYKGNRLIPNPKYPLKTCEAIIDQWEERSRKEPLASEIANVEKRLFVNDLILEADGERFRAKYYRSIGARRRIEALLTRAESVRNFRASLRLAEAGILTAEPLCVWGSWKAGIHDWSVLLMKDLGDHHILPDYLDAMDPANRAEKSRISLALARALAKLHDAGVYLVDPAKNTLIKEGAAGPDFAFVDFDTVHIFFPPTKRQVARVLRHCIRPPKNWGMFDAAEIEAYVREYLSARQLPHWFDSIFPLV